AAVGAVRRRDRWTLLLLAMLAVQLVIWLTATHLFARFAAVMLIPALVLAGRAAGSEHTEAESEPLTPPPPPSSKGRQRAKPQEKEGKCSSKTTALTAAVLFLLVAGTGYNLYRLGRLYYDHTRVGGVSIDAYGRTDWFVTGQWPGS